MSFLGSSQIYFGISAVTTIVILPLFFVVKKRQEQQGQGYSEQVILFSRYPVPGVTKTRLIGELGEQGAARAQNVMTDYLLHQLTNFQLQYHHSNMWVEVKYHGGSPKEMEYWLGWRRKYGKLRCSWSKQDTGHLGLKMAAAFEKAFDRNAERVVLIGSDIPGINKDIFELAFDKLKSDHDMVLGPAKDGGYYLVALNIEAYRKLGSLGKLFEGMDWGTEKVFSQQKQVAESLDVKLDVLPQILQDVDHPEDLAEFEEKTGVSIRQIKEPVLSVIIPVLNEANNILETLNNVIKNCSYKKYTEIVVIDGGSNDGTVENVEDFAKTNTDIQIHVVKGTKGRGVQLNSGVKTARGDNLLFLHADTRLPARFDQHILLTLSVPGVSAGAFKFGLDVLHSSSNDSNYSRFFEFQMKILEFGTNLRAKYFELPYGDQALFMSRQKFDAVGGFPDWPLMEDYELVKKLQKEGHISIVEDEYAITSARRWARLGFIRGTGFNTLMVILYNLGVHPNTLAKWYYGLGRR